MDREPIVVLLGKQRICEYWQVGWRRFRTLISMGAPIYKTDIGYMTTVKAMREWFESVAENKPEGMK